MGNQSNLLTPDYMGTEGVKPPPEKNPFIEKIFYKNISDLKISEIKEPLMKINGKFPECEFELEKLQEKFRVPLESIEEEV
jgi:hypothetical protein